VLLGWLSSVTPIVLVPADLTLAHNLAKDESNPLMGLWGFLYWCVSVCVCVC
jgi:hypothetical protein